MRIILKILAAPFVVVLTILWAVLVFLFAWAKTIVEIASGLVMIIAIILFIGKETTGGIVFTIIAFLMSPIGIPRIAEWLIDKIGDLNEALKDFIAT
jgi:hypothetical protein